MAAAAGMREASVRRIRRANGLKPHLLKAFKVSNDKRFAEKLEDIVGLYLNPPEHALVLCCDEKSQIQALDRTQPGLPLKRGRAQTLTHDYKRNGTTTLFAALDTLDGAVIGQCLPRHRHQEWLKFLRQIERGVFPNVPEFISAIQAYVEHRNRNPKSFICSGQARASSALKSVLPGSAPKAPPPNGASAARRLAQKASAT